jgi:hypothetical protein
VLLSLNCANTCTKDWFVNATVTAAAELDMQAYVHWDVDKFMDNRTTARTVDILRRYNGSAIKGVMMLASDPIDGSSGLKRSRTGRAEGVQGGAPVATSPVFVGDVAVFNPLIAWGFNNASQAAAVVNSAPQGGLYYVYQNLGSDMHLVEQLGQLAAPHVRFLGHREMIALAAQVRAHRAAGAAE